MKLKDIFLAERQIDNYFENYIRLKHEMEISFMRTLSELKRSLILTGIVRENEFDDIVKKTLYRYKEDLENGLDK